MKNQKHYHSNDFIKECLYYDKDTGVFTWKKTLSNRNKLGNEAGTICHKYRRICINGRNYLAHRLAWFYFYNTYPENEIDHIDGNTLNNSISNLRQATSSQNHQNKRTCHSTNKTSGLLGVSWCKREKKFRAKITKNGKQKSLGYFNNKEEAFNAYLMAKRKIHEFCQI